MSYKISEDGKSIICLVCNMTSHHFKDVEQKYCGNCHRYHRYGVAQNSLGRWIIINAQNSAWAWSGRAWTEHQDGYGRSVHVSNFASEGEALEVAREVFGY